MLRDKPITKTLFLLTVVTFVIGMVRRDAALQKASTLLSMGSSAAWLFLEDD